MRKTHYDPALTDDEWREANFRDDVLQSAIQLGRVATAEKLIDYAKRNGADGVLESAIMLGQNGYRQVEEGIKNV